MDSECVFLMWVVHCNLPDCSCTLFPLHCISWLQLQIMV